VTGAADIGLLRFMRARTDESGVLNDAGNPARVAHAAADLPVRLAAAAQRLRAASVSGDGHSLAYDRLQHEPALIEYRAIARELAAFDPWALSGRGEQIAFWMNVYNALSIDAVLSFGLRKTIREQPGFFRRAAYRIGGHRFSSEEIEHGILRGNRPPLPQLAPPLEPDDPRLLLAIKPPDPRVHFALNCAARSCPPLLVYDGARIDAELDAAAAAFIRSGGVTVEENQVRVSAILLYYAEDFGGARGVAGWLTRYMDNSDQRRTVREAFERGIEMYEPYDWALNRVAPAGEDTA
jgi:hypothetical protein